MKFLFSSKINIMFCTRNKQKKKDQRIGKCKREREILKKLKGGPWRIAKSSVLMPTKISTAFCKEKILISGIIFVSQFERLL